MTLSGEPRQLIENIGMDTTQGRTQVSVSEADALIYRHPLREDLQRRLIWVDRSGREIRQLDARDPLHSDHFALSPNGRQAALSRAGLWLLDAERGTTTRLTTEAADSYPLWSRDGRMLVYTSLRDGVRNLYQVLSNGTEPELLLATPGSKAAHSWSPDGRELLFRDTDPTTRSDLWVVSVEPAGDQSGRLRIAGDGKPIPVAKTPAQELNGQFSPDGGWIAYESNESGRQEVYVQPFRRQGARQRVSIDGGSEPRWRGDGAELFFASSNGQMMAAPIRHGADGSIEAGPPASLFPVRFRGGSPVSNQEYEVSADGKQFLVNMMTEQRSTISVIVNWRP